MSRNWSIDSMAAAGLGLARKMDELADRKNADDIRAVIAMLEAIEARICEPCDVQWFDTVVRKYAVAMLREAKARLDNLARQALRGGDE